MNSHYILLAVVFVAVAHAVAASPVHQVNQEAAQQLQQDQAIAADQQLVRNKRRTCGWLDFLGLFCKEPTYDYSGGDGAIGILGTGGPGGNGGGNGVPYRPFIPVERF